MGWEGRGSIATACPHDAWQAQSPPRCVIICGSRASQALQRSKEDVGKAAGTHAEASGEVHAVNRRTGSVLNQVVPGVLRMHPISVMLTGILLYTIAALTFAALFYAAGDKCYENEHTTSEGRFLEVLWLSIHTFSSVGYGSIYPTCASTQMLVLLESYFAILVQV